MTYNPDRWLSSMIDTLQEELHTRSDVYTGTSDAFEILMEHFASDRPGDEPVFLLTMDRPVIHLSPDIIDANNEWLGQNIVDGLYAPATVDEAGTFEEHRGRPIRVNFDVGCVCTDQAGGASARSRVYEFLDHVFNSVPSRESFRQSSGGIEIVSFSQGRFVPDRINDVRVFRIVGAELVVRVYSRDVASDPVVLVDQEPIQQPDVEIGGEPIVP